MSRLALMALHGVEHLHVYVDLVGDTYIEEESIRVPFTSIPVRGGPSPQLPPFFSKSTGTVEYIQFIISSGYSLCNSLL